MTFPDCYFRHFHVATTPKKDQNHQVLISALDTMINAKALMTWSIYVSVSNVRDQDERGRSSLIIALNKLA